MQENLKRCNTMISNNIMKLPTLLLEYFLSVVSYPTEWLKKYLNFIYFQEVVNMSMPSTYMHSEGRYP